MKESMPVKEIVIIFFSIAFIFFFPHLGWPPIPFGYVIIITIAVWFFLKRTKKNFSDLGFSFKQFEWNAVFIGAITALLIFAFLQYLFFPALRKIIHLVKASLDGFTQVRYQTVNYIFFILLSFWGGGSMKNRFFMDSSYAA